MNRPRSENKVFGAGRLSFLGLMCLVLTVSVLIWGEGVSGQQQKESSCVTCHSKLEGKLKDPVTQFLQSVHHAKGLSCNDCHGGNPLGSDMESAHAISSGYLGTPEPSEIPAFCGKCHSDAGVMKRYNPSLRVDQVQEYLTSVHGKRLKEGDTKVATCISCHGNHAIRAVNDPLSSVYPLNVAETCSKCHANAGYIGPYNIPHDQYSKYKKSVHAQALYVKEDLSAPTCNDCHGNHGAAPPGLTSVANVCGQCHARQSELFGKSPHKAAFDGLGYAECIKCHSNHEILKPTDKMVGIGKGSVCIACHNNDKGWQAAKTIQASMSQLSTNIQKADDILDRAERAGMEVSHPKFDLQSATDALTTARVLIHTVSADQVVKAVEPGDQVALKSYKAGENAFSELRFRRQGLAVSLVFIGFLAVLVYLKIRQIESGESAK